MVKIIVNVDWEDNYGAWIEELPGCVAVSNTYENLKKDVATSIDMHIKGMQEDELPLPIDISAGYELVFKMNIRALLQRYSGILTNAGLERLTGINQKQLWSYANGLSKPRKAQVEKIENALHALGKELTSVVL